MQSNLILLPVLLAPLTAMAWELPLLPRHGSEGHGEDHGGGQGVGHGHDMAHGAFNFTPSGIPWPTCLRDCCNNFFEYFPEPVNHPLCVSSAFYDNVTDCVVQNCTEYEQGAYTVVVPIECPDNDTLTAEEVKGNLESGGGSPQACEGIDNSTIECENSTTTDSGAPGPVWVHSKGAWVLSAAIAAVPVLALL